MTVQSNYN